MRSCVVLSAVVAATLAAAPARPGADLPAGAIQPGSRDTEPRERRLRLYHTHTGERIDVVYRRGDDYVAEGVVALENYLKDFRTGDVKSFDPRLFDVLADLAEAAGRPDGEFHVISAYRSAKTNEMLRARTSGVAKYSLHMEALALDVRLPGVETSVLRDVALALRRGGVGYYAGSDFVHVDLGHVRRW